MRSFLLTLSLLGLFSFGAFGETGMVVPARQNVIFAHYMGCWPAGSGPLTSAKETQEPLLRHDSPDVIAERGGHVRNYDLVPWGSHLTPEESADLEIRRAMRIGLDGFAVDAWAGSDLAKATLDALFKVAEEKDYPFALTVCIDHNCGGDIVDTVKYLLEKHGSSPKLARRDGKPLVFGYLSFLSSWKYLQQRFPEKKGPEIARLRSTPEGWSLMGQAFVDASSRIGQPIYWYYCMSAFFHGVDRKLLPEHGLTAAAAAIALHVQAVGGFTWLGVEQSDVARAVRSSGAEWGAPIGMFQKECIPYEVYAGVGLNWMISGWATVRNQEATLLQLVTWNDYGENSNVAPAYNTRYTLYDLNGYFIRWWKTGVEPKPDHDRVYLIYRKYPPEVKVFPFRQGPYRESCIEVVTILPRPATVCLPGRNIRFDAPAGFSRKQFPLTPGPVVAELLRDGAVKMRLTSPEPITDRPFREDNGWVCWSSEEVRLWQEDFGDTKPYWWSEYGDLDGNGLPNWFEMYWFGKFGNLATARGNDPKALGANGKTLLQNYLDQTDPTKKPVPYSEIPRKGLLAWYSADRGVVTDDQGRVCKWQDQSGTGLDLTAVSEEGSPRLLPKCWNGQPVLELDGVKNGFSCRLPQRDYPSMSIVAVYAGRPKDQVCQFQNGVNNPIVSIPTNQHGGDSGYSLGLTVGMIERASGEVVSQTKASFGQGEQPQAVTLGFAVHGADISKRGASFTGKVAEVLVYSPALSAGELRKVTEILRTRYGL